MAVRRAMSVAEISLIFTKRYSEDIVGGSYEILHTRGKKAA